MIDSSEIKKQLEIAVEFVRKGWTSPPVCGFMLYGEDPRWLESEGWMKYQQKIYPGGESINVHYNLNPTLKLMDDFKIKTQ